MNRSPLRLIRELGRNLDRQGRLRPLWHRAINRAMPEALARASWPLLIRRAREERAQSPPPSHPVAAMVVPDFPRTGGYERQAVVLSRELRRGGAEILLVTNQRPGVEIPSRFEGLPLLALPGWPAEPVNPLLHVSAWLRFLGGDGRGVTAIHAHALSPFSSAAILAGRLLGVGTLLKAASGADRAAFGAPAVFEDGFARQGAAWAHACVAINDDLHGMLAGFGARGILDLPNGVDATVFHPPSPAERVQARRALGLGDHHLVLAYVGRLTREKGVGDLVDAWAMAVRRMRHDAAPLLLLAGDGPQRPELEERARNSGVGGGVRFLGEISDIPGFLAAAGGFVLPSWNEGVSNALLEAMASGLPCIATAVGGTPAVLGECGWLVRPRDPRELAEAIAGWAYDPPRRGKSGENARRRIEEHYSIGAIAARYRELYGAWLAGAPPLPLAEVWRDIRRLPGQ
ncbi:MAG: D-inositol-3-phosphate glycosyltransferase [Myxococcota bacterium]|nr:D-inositol-3-phosphate glycosyltransferase [Myxococcota bacterium]